MATEKLKYAEYLDKYANCPPRTCNTYNKSLFRWLNEADNHPDNFKPILLIDPSRTFPNDDIYCSGYALSMFDTEEGAFNKYKKLVGDKVKLGKRLGTIIGEIAIAPIDGVGTIPELDNYEHLDFYEFEGVDLSRKITNFVEIFDKNGEYKR